MHINCHPERSGAIPWKLPFRFQETLGEAVRFPTYDTIIRAFAFVAVFLCSLISARAQTMSPGDIKALLARIREQRAATPNMQADFEEQRKIHLLDEPITSSGKVSFQAPNKFRLERKGNSPSVTVSDGQVLWIYYPKFKSAERYSLGKRSPLDAAITTITTALNLQEVESMFHITGNKTGSDYDLELTPRNPSMKRIFQKLELRLNKDLFADRTEMIQSNGDHIITSYSNPAHAALPESTFEFAPPPGTDISTPLGK
jgi:outer membrane lipoprotein-sorting protein